MDLVDLFTLYRKKDESQITSDGLKLSIASPFSLSKIVRGIYNEPVVHNYVNLEISKNRPIGALHSKKGLSLTSTPIP